MYARGVEDVGEWNEDLEKHIKSYAHNYVIGPTEPGQRPRDYALYIHVSAEDIDHLFEDLMQVTVNFHTDDGGIFTLLRPYWDEGEASLEQVAKYDVRCNCAAEEAGEAADRILREEGE
jgi:hypothetical protein